MFVLNAVDAGGKSKYGVGVLSTEYSTTEY